MAPKPKPTTTTKARSSAAPKPKSTKSSTKARKALSPSPTPSLDSPPAALGLDKALVLRIILAKLEASKTCDWYELSLKLNKDADGGKAGDAKGKDKAKGRKKGSDDEHKGRGLSGSELYDLYHYVSLLPFKIQLTAENPPGTQGRPRPLDRRRDGEERHQAPWHDSYCQRPHRGGGRHVRRRR